MQVSFSSASIHSSAIYPNIQATQQADIAERLCAARAEHEYNDSVHIFDKSYFAKDGIVSEVIVADGSQGRRLNLMQNMLHLIKPEENTLKGAVLKRKYLDMLGGLKTSAAEGIVRLPKKLRFTTY